MPKTIKEFQLNQSTGEVSVEYSDDSTSKFNAADMVTAQTDPVTGRVRNLSGGVVTDAGLAEYGGIVATGGATMTATLVSFGSKQAYCRAVAYARNDLSEVSAVFGNFYVQAGTGEVAGAGSMTVEAAIEYPLGTYTRMTFGGQNAGVLASGDVLESDPVAVAIPDGAKFWIRQYYTSEAGSIHYLSATGIADTTQGESFDHATSGLANNIMGGSMPDAANGSIIIRPLAFVGKTTKPSWIIYGDSRQAGVVDQLSDGKGLRGELARAIGAKYGYANCSCAGAYASQFVSLSARQRSLLQYATHVACGYGINDLNGGWDAATVQSSLESLHALVAGDCRKVYQTTFAPALVTSSDGYATVANQTADPHNAARVAVNTWVRSIPSPLTDIFDTATAVESVRDSGKWKAPGYTTDGTHGTRLANEETAKAVNF